MIALKPIQSGKAGRKHYNRVAVAGDTGGEMITVAKGYITEIIGLKYPICHVQFHEAIEYAEEAAAKFNKQPESFEARVKPALLIVDESAFSKAEGK